MQHLTHEKTSKVVNFAAAQTNGKVHEMLIQLSTNEVRFLATASQFNAVSRAIRKCKVTAVIRLPLEKHQCTCAVLQIRCTPATAAVGVDENTFFMAYPENLRRVLASHFSMPVETQAGSQFVLSAAQMDCLHSLLGDSLTMVLEVSDSDSY